MTPPPCRGLTPAVAAADRKSTPLNSSHLVISHAVFCLKKKTLPRDPCSLTPTLPERSPGNDLPLGRPAHQQPCAQRPAVDPRRHLSPAHAPHPAPAPHV